MGKDILDKLYELLYSGFLKCHVQIWKQNSQTQIQLHYIPKTSYTWHTIYL